MGEVGERGQVGQWEVCQLPIHGLFLLRLGQLSILEGFSKVQLLIYRRGLSRILKVGFLPGSMTTYTLEEVLRETSSHSDHEFSASGNLGLSRLQE